VNTSFMMGGALGLAVLASIAAAQTNGAIAAGASQIAALTDGYHAAFAIGAAFAITAAVLGFKVLRIQTPAARQDFATDNFAAAAD
jgi:hypothetical protein